jgi:hypothetical protein
MREFDIGKKEIEKFEVAELDENCVNGFEERWGRLSDLFQFIFS